MIKVIKKYLWKVEGMDFSDNISSKPAKFMLSYNAKVIGVLTWDNSEWIFAYSDEFKQDPFIKPILDFPDINKIYKNKELWPFFATRIPSLNQPFHLKKLKKANIENNNTANLLKLFGKKTITNPFHLKALF